MAKNESLVYEEDVKRDITNGFTMKEIVKKYGVSEYFIKKWSRSIYKKIDMDMLVRRRYCKQVCEIRSQIEAKLGMAVMRQKELNDDVLEEWDEIIKRGLYDFAKIIVEKN